MWLNANTMFPAYTGNGGNVTIPSQIDGKTVTAIGNGAFRGGRLETKDGKSDVNLTGVTIPDTVTSIGDHAFEGNVNLTGVRIGSGVKTIGEDAFRECLGLTAITIPDSVTSIDGRAFFDASLTSVTIGSGITSIDWFTFVFNLRGMRADFSVSPDNQSYASDSQGILYNKAKTEILHVGRVSGSIAIPEGVKEIGRTFDRIGVLQGAFEGLTGLTSVTIPNSVTSIGGAAFRGCTGLTSVPIPNSVTSIDQYAFLGCTGLTSVTIPNSVTSIGTEAFRDCIGLRSVTIPNRVTTIGDSAFRGCAGLTGSLTIPASVTHIGKAAFRDCTGLTSVTIGNGVKIIDGESSNLISARNSRGGITRWYGQGGAFEGCTALTSVTIGSSVETIGDHAFRDTALTSINIPASVTDIGEMLMHGENSRFPDSLASITVDPSNSAYASQDGVVYNKAKTEIVYAPRAISGSITIPGSVTSIPYAFYGRGNLTGVTISNGVTSIGDKAFYNCSSLSSVTMPGSIKTIGESAFLGCRLRNLTMPAGVTSIGKSAFSSSGLPSVTIPASVTSIGDRAFYNCSSLSSVTIPASVTSIGLYAFEGGSLTNITVSPDNQNYASQDGILYNKAKTEIVYAPRAISGHVTIPNSMTSIPDHAFWVRTHLKSVTIPNSVTSIGQSAFYGCTRLTSVTFQRAGITFSTYNNTSFPNSASLQTAYAAGGIGTYTRDNSAVLIPDTVPWVKQ